MILEQYYLSNPANVGRAMEDTGLAFDEIEEKVGYFSKQSARHGQMHGKIILKINRKGDEVVELRHDFNNKLYWSSND